MSFDPWQVIPDLADDKGDLPGFNRGVPGEGVDLPKLSRCGQKVGVDLPKADLGLANVMADVPKVKLHCLRAQPS